MFFTPALLILGLGAAVSQAHFVQIVIRSAQGEKDVSPISGMLLSTPSSGSGSGIPQLRAVQTVSTSRETEGAYWEATWGVYRNVGASSGTPCSSFPCKEQNSQSKCFGGLCGSTNSKSKSSSDEQRESLRDDWTVYNWGKAGRIVNDHARDKTPFVRDDDNFFGRLAYLGYSEEGNGQVELFWPKEEISKNKWWTIGSPKGIRYLAFNNWGLMVEKATKAKVAGYGDYEMDVVRPSVGSTMYACYPEEAFSKGKEPKTLSVTLWQRSPTDKGRCDKVTLKARVIISDARNFRELREQEMDNDFAERMLTDRWKTNARVRNNGRKKQLKADLKSVDPIHEQSHEDGGSSADEGDVPQWETDEPEIQAIRGAKNNRRWL